MKVIPKDKLIIRKSFALYYGSTQIWAEELDRLSIHQDIVIEKFLNDMKQIAKTSSPSLIAVHLNETVINSEIADIIIDNLYNAKNYIKKVVFVGLNLKNKMLFNKSKNKIGQPLEFSIKFINDYEKAKEWLVIGK